MLALSLLSSQPFHDEEKKVLETGWKFVTYLKKNIKKYVILAFFAEMSSS
jgi:hypothetical protein